MCKDECVYVCVSRPADLMREREAWTLINSAPTGAKIGCRVEKCTPSISPVTTSRKTSGFCVNSQNANWPGSNQRVETRQPSQATIMGELIIATNLTLNNGPRDHKLFPVLTCSHCGVCQRRVCRKVLWRQVTHTHHVFGLLGLHPGYCRANMTVHMLWCCQTGCSGLVWTQCSDCSILQNIFS